MSDFHGAEVDELRAALAAKDAKLSEMDALLTAAYHDEAKAKAEIAQLKEALTTANGVVVSGTLKLNEARAEIARLREALEDFDKWSKAYPTDIFVEPDLEKAHKLLQDGGMTLDAISAHVMRLALRGIGERARAAIKSEAGQ